VSGCNYIQSSRNFNRVSIEKAAKILVTRRMGRGAGKLAWLGGWPLSRGVNLKDY
jgi:hypothetical protein